MNDPRSNAELEQCVYAGLALNPDFLRRVAALSELCRRLGELETERDRLHAAHMKCIVGVEELVQDEIISAGRGREIHGMTPDEQREYWRLVDSARKEPRDV